MRTVRALNAVLIVWLIAFSFWAYPQLPDTIPLHFGADGTPDRWGSRSLLSWLMLPLIGLGTVALMYFLAWLTPKRPELINMPGKDRLLKLPPDLQQEVLREVVGVFDLISLQMLVMFSLLQYGMYESALTGGKSGWVTAGVILALVSTPFVLIVVLTRQQRALDDAVRRQRTQGAETPDPV